MSWLKLFSLQNVDQYLYSVLYKLTVQDDLIG